MRKLITLLVMIVLFINFIFYWLSICPYAKIAVLSDGNYIINSGAMKANLIKYLLLSVITMIMGITQYIRISKLNLKKQKG